MTSIEYNCAAMTPASVRAIADVVCREAEAGGKDAAWAKAEFAKRAGPEPVPCAAKICEVKAERFFRRKRRGQPLPRPLVTVDCLTTFHFYARG